MADSVGLGNVTLAALAQQLGVRQPSLYKHVAGLPALRRLLAIRAKFELGDLLARAAVGRSGGDAITAMSLAYREWARKHPGRYEAAQRAPDLGDAEDERASAVAVGVCADVLLAYDLTGTDAIDAIRALRSTLHGFVSLEAAGAFGLPVDVDRSFDRLVRSFVGALSRWPDDARVSPRG